MTAFDKVVDGQQTLHSGDVLRLATKPVLVGRALHFIVGEVSCDITLPPLQFAQPVSTSVWLPGDLAVTPFCRRTLSVTIMVAKTTEPYFFV